MNFFQNPFFVFLPVSDSNACEFFPILFPFPLLVISLPLPFFASQFDFLVVKSSYCVGNSLHCILKNKVVWHGFLFGLNIILNDKIKILALEGSNYFIALVQLPPRFFFHWVSHSSDEECKHPYMELLSEENSRTMVYYQLCCLPFLFTSLGEENAVWLCKSVKM